MRKIPHIRKIKEQERHQHLINIKSPEKIQVMNYGLIPFLADKFLTLTLMKKRAYRNTLNPMVSLRQIKLPSLPRSFNGFKILFITDFHIDGNPALVHVIKEVVSDLEFDCAVFGGDYRFLTRGPADAASELMKAIVTAVSHKAPVYGVLGNHDVYEIGTAMEEAGASILINENIVVQRDVDAIALCGIDDCHYYTAHDFEQAEENLDDSTMKILLSHSAEVYKEAADRGYALYLGGHTHAGQICLPGRIPVITESHAPRSMVYGEWNHNTMKGYTSAGIGTSGVPARINCPPEIAVIELLCE